MESPKSPIRVESPAAPPLSPVDKPLYRCVACSKPVKNTPSLMTYPCSYCNRHFHVACGLTFQDPFVCSDEYLRALTGAEPEEQDFFDHDEDEKPAETQAYNSDPESSESSEPSQEEKPIEVQGNELEVQGNELEEKDQD